LNLAEAENAVGGFAIGLDMTCRDIQQQAKQQGRPWELAKGFDGSAPCTAIQLASYADLQQLGQLSLTRNGQLVQAGDWRTMVWSVPELIVEVSRYLHLHAGDLIFTGTPAGVGCVLPGDKLEARIEGFSQTLTLDVA
jgi:fumarylpyruvate hydrolase